jgi:hypothetical protein
MLHLVGYILEYNQSTHKPYCCYDYLAVQMPEKSSSSLHADVAALISRTALVQSPPTVQKCQLHNNYEKTRSADTIFK